MSSNLREASKRAFQTAFVSRLPIVFGKLIARTSKRDLLIATVIGALANLAFIGLLLFVDYSALLATLGIKLKIANDSNIPTKISIVVGKLLIDFINAMGAAYSEIEREKKADEDREKADEDREKAEKRHNELLVSISQRPGIQTTEELETLVLDFKKQLFKEHQAAIIKHIANVVVDHTNELDVMYRYDLESLMTPLERMQAPLED
jgi:hypothetical protein